jgi:hypothetical protein
MRNLLKIDDLLRNMELLTLYMNANYYSLVFAIDLGLDN